MHSWYEGTSPRTDISSSGVRSAIMRNPSPMFHSSVASQWSITFIPRLWDTSTTFFTDSRPRSIWFRNV